MTVQETTMTVTDDNAPVGSRPFGSTFRVGTDPTLWMLVNPTGEGVPPPPAGTLLRVDVAGGAVYTIDAAQVVAFVPYKAIPG